MLGVDGMDVLVSDSTDLTMTTPHLSETLDFDTKSSQIKSVLIDIDSPLFKIGTQNFDTKLLSDSIFSSSGFPCLTEKYAQEVEMLLSNSLTLHYVACSAVGLP